MTRVLFWNIESFGLNKIFSAIRPRNPSGAAKARTSFMMVPSPSAVK